jgi:hypothetical protein
LKCFVKSNRAFKIAPEIVEADVRYCALGYCKNEKYVDKAMTCNKANTKNTRNLLKKAIKLRMYKNIKGTVANGKKLDKKMYLPTRQ